MDTQQVNKETILFVMAVFCIGMLASEPNRWLALLLTAILISVALAHVLFKYVSISSRHIPLILLPLLYLVSSIVTNGVTFFSIGQTLLMCVPLIASLCVTNTRSALLIIIVGVSFLAITSLLGGIIPGIPNTFTPSGHFGDPRMRLQTTLLYANTGAMLFGCGIFALLGMKSHQTVHRILKYALLFLLVVCLLLTGSRLAITITVVLLCSYFLLLINAKKILFAFWGIGIIVTIVAITTIPERVIGTSLALRLIYWSDAIRAIIRYPFFGLGAEGFIFRIHELQSAIYVTRTVHNGFLQAGIDAGIPAVITLLVLFLISLKNRWKENKGAFFSLLLLMFHSAVDFNLSFFPVLMVLGMLSLSQEEENCYPVITKQTIIHRTTTVFLAFIISTSSVYLSVGERFHSVGERAARFGEFGRAEEAYRIGLSMMPQDFRITFRLAWVYIQTGRPENAIILLKDSDPLRFNRAVRSQLLVMAYRDLAKLEEWDNETLSQIKYAPFRQEAYLDRDWFLLIAYLSSFITEFELEYEQALLRIMMAEANESLHWLSGFRVERDMLLRLD